MNVYEGFGLVYEDWPNDPDPLHQLPDVDSATAASLNDAGVFRFRQIAAWTRENIEAFSEDLGVRPSTCDIWVQQARNHLAAKRGN